MSLKITYTQPTTIGNDNFSLKKYNKNIKNATLNFTNDTKFLHRITLSCARFHIFMWERKSSHEEQSIIEQNIPKSKHFPCERWVSPSQETSPPSVKKHQTCESTLDQLALVKLLNSAFKPKFLKHWIARWTIEPLWTLVQRGSRFHTENFKYWVHMGTNTCSEIKRWIAQKCICWYQFAFLAWFNHFCGSGAVGFIQI